MQEDHLGQYRNLLIDDPPAFLDRVNTPWDHVPDLVEYNQQAYRRIVRALKELTPARSAENVPNSQGILILGEAGTGKTHLLMRVARNLSESNHILFVRKPNNEDAVAQHIWANVVNSLTRSLPESGTKRSQLDDLLAHVFTSVLVPEFEQDIQEGKDPDQKQRWVERLQDDPYNLFNMLGEGEKRQDNMDRIRRRTLRFLQSAQPDVDQKIAHVLITYCFVSREDRKRVLLTWLSGQDVEESEAKDLGLPASWVTIDDTSSDASTQQQREEQALRAIRTIGILSTYYQPLILAFDQLEGLRDQERLTQRWGDSVREIFTMTPNFLIVTCIFPSLWESWFSRSLDRSVSERIAQQTVTLDSFAPAHGLKMLAKHLEPAFAKHRLPTNIYPFTHMDVNVICASATSPRVFIQCCHSHFESWLDGETAATDLRAQDTGAQVVSQESVDQVMRSALLEYESDQRKSFDSEIPMEQDFFGRIRNIAETLLRLSGDNVTVGKAACGTKVMPSNVILRLPSADHPVCVSVLYSEGSSFAARMRNFIAAWKSSADFRHAVVVRDSRCRQITGKVSKQHIEDFERLGGTYINAGSEEICPLSAIYDTLVAIEEHDLSLGSHEIDKRQFVGFLRSEGSCRRTQLFRSLANHSACIARAIGVPAQRPEEALHGSTTQGSPQASTLLLSETQSHKSRGRHVQSPSDGTKDIAVDVLLGDSGLDSAHVGVLGKLTSDRRVIGISFGKPQCMVLLGYMGSGKSYALGVLIENALMLVPNLCAHRSPVSVVAFNFRRNPESRFEYWGFGQPNSKSAEVAKLRSEYQVEPSSVQHLNVFGYGPELERRKASIEEYRHFQFSFELTSWAPIIGKS